MAIIYLKNRTTLIIDDDKAIEIRKTWLDRTTELSKDLIINKWRGTYRDIARVEIEGNIQKQSFTKQDLVLESPYIKKILADESDTNMARNFYLNQKEIMRGNTVINPYSYKKYDRLFEYVRRSIQKRTVK